MFYNRNVQKSKSENSKEKILAAATKLFAQKGFDGVSIREICKEADVNICMISYYWGGKKELYHGIIEDLLERRLPARRKLYIPVLAFLLCKQCLKSARRRQLAQ